MCMCESTFINAEALRACGHGDKRQNKIKATDTRPLPCWALSSRGEVAGVPASGACRVEPGVLEMLNTNRPRPDTGRGAVGSLDVRVSPPSRRDTRSPAARRPPRWRREIPGSDPDRARRIFPATCPAPGARKMLRPGRGPGRTHTHPRAATSLHRDCGLALLTQKSWPDIHVGQHLATTLSIFLKRPVASAFFCISPSWGAGITPREPLWSLRAQSWSVSPLTSDARLLPHRRRSGCTRSLVEMRKSPKTELRLLSRHRRAQRRPSVGGRSRRVVGERVGAGVSATLQVTCRSGLVHTASCIQPGAQLPLAFLGQP